MSAEVDLWQVAPYRCHGGKRCHAEWHHGAGMVEGTRVGHCESLWRQDVGGEKGSGLSEELRESLLWAVSHDTITGIPGPLLL